MTNTMSSSTISVSTAVNPNHLVGHVVTGLYPRHNCTGMPVRLERRRVLVERVRDTEAEPLDPVTVALAPALKRGRVLLTGLDLDKRAERSFYLDSMADVELSIDQHNPNDWSGGPWLVTVGRKTIFETRIKSLADARAEGYNEASIERGRKPRAIVVEKPFPRAQHRRNK